MDCAAYDKQLAIAPLWLQPLRWTSYFCVCAYNYIAYRIRGWGRLPLRRGPTLIVANHQHDIESAIIVATLALTSFSWRYPIFTVSSRRMWEPGFLAERIPWLSFLLRGINLGPLFAALGMQPIENELHARTFVSLAYMLLQRHGDRPLVTVFRERALQRLPSEAKTLSDILKPAHFKVGRAPATLSELREPYRTDALQATREQLEADLAHFERLGRDGATIFLTPEGYYTRDGKMQRMRGVLSRLAPLAKIWLAGISYDPFVGRRLSLLYRVAPALDGLPLDVQLKALRPVTVSALLATWLHSGPGTFGEHEAIDAVQRQLGQLPRTLFVEPDLRRHPEASVRAALAGMARLGMLRAEAGRSQLTEQRTHPQFPHASDMVSYQANFHEETLEGARRAGGENRR